MDYALHYLTWLVAGVLLMLLEFLIPGLVVIFLGLGALVTSTLLYFGWIQNVYAAIAAFVASSVVFLLTIRRLVLRFYPSDSEKVETDEDALLIGQVAETMTEINPRDFSGRIRFSGTTWSAKSVAGAIAAGRRVRIAGRENIHLFVSEISE